MDVKLGTDLNISLNTPERLRENSFELNVGYNKEFSRWTLIIKYIGDLEELINDYNLLANQMLASFAIIDIEEDKIFDFARDARVIYIEKPKLFVQERVGINGFVQSCMSVPYFELGLRGEGITVAVIDSGIDIYHQDFYTENNGVKESKLVGLWDQTLEGNPPNDYSFGAFFDRENINYRLNNADVAFESRDISGHGTGVAGIISACTPQAELLIVKLNTKDTEETDTISLMLGIDFAVRYSIDNNVPIVINLSYGNNSGDHNGNSVLERYIDEVALLTRVTFVVGAGNDGDSGRHVQINMGNDSWYGREFQVPEGEGSIYIQIWRAYQDRVDVFLRTPFGEVLGPFNDYENIMVYNLDNMSIRVLNQGPSPINTMQETYISIIPIDRYIESGLWSISFNPKSIINGRVDMWLPVIGSTNTDLFFLTPTESTTLTVPSTARNVITVGAYNQNSKTYASFSGRGFTVEGNIKPDLLAPGVNIDVPSVGGGYRVVSGTSFSAPFVSSGAAMLMEYGISRENDVFLYGEKVKAFLIKGAKTLDDIMSVPNNATGWGTLCVEDSLP